jgi:glyoxylase-like metal-dependent hydrolase (beta-lactamase superfamily II)
MTRSLLGVPLTLLLLVASTPAVAQDGRAALEAAAKALGAPGLKSLEITASGFNFAPGQAQAPGGAWPKFNVKSLTRSINYDTATLRDVYVRTQFENPPRAGGVQPLRGEVRNEFVVQGDHAWNVTPQAAIPAPITLAVRQFELWSTPHGVIRAAMAQNASVLQGRFVPLSVPGRYSAKATLDAAGLVSRVDAVLANPVVGDFPVTVEYSDYKDFGGVKFPTRIKQTMGGFPTLELTVTEVKPNASVDVAVPDNVRQATAPYALVTSQMAADGVWYITGGTHHSVAIEMKDHIILVEAPLNDQRTLAVVAEVRGLVANKPIRYVVNSHHHFDHAGGVRAAAAEGATVISHEVSRAWWDKTLATRATVSPDHLTKSGKKPAPAEGVRDKRVLTDGARTVEIHHIAGILHADDMLLVYLPKEKLLIEADAYTPGPPNTAPPSPPSPFNVALVDNITRLGLTVDRVLPLHGRIVPLADLLQAAGRTN